MNILSTLKNLKDLTEIEIVVISNVLEITELIENLEKTTLDHVVNGKYDDAKKTIEKSNYFRHTPVFLQKMKKQVVEHCSLKTLNKIINEEKFESVYSWDSSHLIPKSILPKMSSFDKFHSSHPKANIYKELGATIVM